MRYYRSYMDRQKISAQGHEKLMNLDVPHKAPRRPWAGYGALAACAVLIAGIGVWKLLPGFAPGPEAGRLTVADTPAPVQTEKPAQLQTDDTPPVEPLDGFVINSPVGESASAFYCMPAIHFSDMTGSPEISAMRVYIPGSFTVNLTLEDVQKIFWGPEGIPETYRTETERQDLPWALFWDGYTVHGTAWYDGQGQFTELTLWGRKGRAGFTLELRLGKLPFSCCVEMGREDEISEFNGVEVTGWSKVCDRDWDGQTDYTCGSEFMTDNGIGVRFESWNNGADEHGVDGEGWFNTLFVRQALTSGLHLDHLMIADDIPAWRDVMFDTLEQARQEADFAPYLPTEEPEGYSAYTGNKDFSAHLSYQEGNQNVMLVRWTQDYDNVEVKIYIPEGTSTARFEPVDINVPESYDTRLYEIPWCDSVPEEYQLDFSSVTFRAEDMSLDAVMARETPHDTGGVSFRFNVLYASGVVVSYSCDGMTAEQVWDLVSAALYSQNT